MVVQSAYKCTYVLLIVTNDRPHTMEVVGVCPWEHGGSEAIVTAEIFVASTGTLGGERGKEGYYGHISTRLTVIVLSMCTTSAQIWRKYCCPFITHLCIKQTTRCNLFHYNFQLLIFGTSSFWVFAVSKPFLCWYCTLVPRPPVSSF